MAIVKIICECGECIEGVKENLVKAFQTNFDAKDKFADPLMEDLVEEADSWYNYFFLKMIGEIGSILEEKDYDDGEEYLFEKAIGHKYIKREGVPGNYKYWYRDEKTGELIEGKNPEEDEKPKPEKKEERPKMEEEIKQQIKQLWDQQSEIMSLQDAEKDEDKKRQFDKLMDDLSLKRRGLYEILDEQKKTKTIEEIGKVENAISEVNRMMSESNDKEEISRYKDKIEQLEKLKTDTKNASTEKISDKEKEISEWIESNKDSVYKEADVGKMEEFYKEQLVENELDLIQEPGTYKNEKYGKQIKGLSSYKGASYKKINSLLRKGEDTNSTIDQIDLAFGEGKLFVEKRNSTRTSYEPPPSISGFSVFQKAFVAQENMAVYRAIGKSKQTSKMEFREGEIIEDKGYVSTSIDKQGALTISNSIVFCKINVPKGSKGVYLEGITGYKQYEGLEEENEWLLPRNSKFKIIKVEKKEHNTYATMDLLEREAVK